MTLTPRRTAGLGWRPDTPDNRDKVFRPRRKITRLPLKVDLRTSGFMPDVYDQGNLGSCTANAIGAAYEFEQRRQGLTDFMPSRLFIYYGEREVESSIQSDSGAEIRDGMKVINHLGVPDEKLWPYFTNAFASRPPQTAYDDALKHQTITYAAVPVVAGKVKAALASGTPVVIGFTVYSWFENPSSLGVVKPVANSPLLGGHAVLVVGYEHLKGHGTTDYAIVRNSWGPGWGDGGYCYMPLHWICDTHAWNADDFWAIQSVEAA
jgi:C1A family cysteine protease